MIPYYIALLGYIPIAAIIMSARNNALAFSLAYLGGLMFLPSGLDIEVPGVPDLTKDNVPGIGILIGTILFHPRIFDRFRLSKLDFLFLLGMLAAFVTAMLNGFGPRFGLSQMVDVGLSFMLPVVLARIHLGTPASLRTFMVTLVLLACVYVPFSMWEFRMSPQFHTWTYGYFQHVFQQHMRGTFWRPIVFFYHALALGRFYALVAFIALYPARRDLVALFGPYGKFIFLIPLFGLLLEQSISPVILFVFLCVLYHAVQWRHWVVWVMPVIAFTWLGMVFAGIEVGYGSVGRFTPVSSERADSFEYRLQALREYRSVILNRPWFGHGGFGHGRIEGRATDSQTLILLLNRGVVGTAVYLGWWFAVMWSAARTAQRLRGTPMGKRAAAVAGFASIALTFTVVDAAIEHFLLFLVASVFAIDQWMRMTPGAEQLPRQLSLAAVRRRLRGPAIEAAP
jgi:hypothetical protein